MSKRLIFCFFVIFFLISGCRQVVTSKVSIQRVKALKALSEGSILGSQGYSAADAGSGAGESATNVDVGRLLFQRYCESCHSLQPVGPRLEGNYAADEKSESDKSMVLYGFGDMPGFRHKLTNYQIEDILRYLRFRYEEEHPGEVSGD